MNFNIFNLSKRTRTIMMIVLFSLVLSAGSYYLLQKPYIEAKKIFRHEFENNGEVLLSYVTMRADWHGRADSKNNKLFLKKQEFHRGTLFVKIEGVAILPDVNQVYVCFDTNGSTQQAEYGHFIWFGLANENGLLTRTISPVEHKGLFSNFIRIWFRDVDVSNCKELYIRVMLVEPNKDLTDLTTFKIY